MENLAIPGYEIKKKIGEGGSRTVFLAKRDFVGDEVAIKVFKHENLHKLVQEHRSRHELEEILRTEIELLRKLSHPNIVRYFNHGLIGDTFFIEEEYVNGGTLLEHINELEPFKAVSIFLNILNGVTYAHNHGILLRDWKLNNTLVSKDLTEIKLDDLEMAGKLGDFFEMSSGTKGCEKYAAPELFYSPATIKTDIYALGCGLLYLLSKQNSGIELISKLSEEEYNKNLDTLLQKVDKKYREVIAHCLEHKPENRFDTVLQLKQALIDKEPILSLLLKELSCDAQKQVYLIKRDYGKIIVIRSLENTDLEEITKIYKNAFKIHNIFSKPEEQVIEYLRESHTTYSERGGGYLVCEVNGNLTCALLLRIKDYDALGQHIRVVYNHAMSSQGFEDSMLGYLFQTADIKLKEHMQTNQILSAKISISLAPSELELKQTLIKTGFETEGKLKNHYRYGEDVEVLGKTISLNQS